MKYQIKLIMGLSLVLASCGNYSEQKKQSPSSDLAANAAKLNFAGIQAEIFARGSTGNCTSCHQQYGTYEGVRKELDPISNAINANRMPKNASPLNDKLKQLLANWIAAGAPEFQGQTPSAPVPTELQANFKSIAENILIPKCVVCHNPQGRAKFLDLSSRNSIFAARNGFGGEKLLNFDDPANSYLLAVIQDPTEPMPPLDSNIKALNQAELNILTEWIRLGLP